MKLNLQTFFCGTLSVLLFSAVAFGVIFFADADENPADNIITGKPSKIIYVQNTKGSENPFDDAMTEKIHVLQDRDELPSGIAIPKDDAAGKPKARITDRNTPKNKLKHNTAERARAAEALGYMRAYKAENFLIAALADEAAEVRRNAALSLAWCGSRSALKPLLKVLDDSDWTVRQAAGIALENLTGKNLRFDALGKKDVRQKTIAQLHDAIELLPESGIPAEVLSLIKSADHREAARGLRAAGALGTDAETVKVIAGTLETWRKSSNEKNADAKIRVQTALRVLGRSGLPEAFPVLSDFLRNPQWARYAADALGDFGGDDAAGVLMDVFPSHARQIDNKILASEIAIKAQATHPSDAPHLDARDRILSVPYAILFSLSRIQFHDPKLNERLRTLAPLIARQVPLDVDRLVFYEEEPFQKIFRSLLERSGEGETLLEHAFRSLNAPAKCDASSSTVEIAGKDHKPFVQVAESSTKFEAFKSPVLLGGDEPFGISYSVQNWNDLYLVVDSVEDYSMDRANWANAKLTDAKGQEVYLDTLQFVSANQEYGKLMINRSANFPDLRIGKKNFARGLHTHASSVIHYKLDGKYTQFSVKVGVCASRQECQGSVRFLILPTPPDPVPRPLITNTSFNSNLMLTLCRDSNVVPRIIPLLDHSNRWVRINAAKTLLFIGDKRAIPAIRERLAASKRDGDYGEFAPPPYNSSAQGQDEYNSPTPRDREALIMALGGFRDVESVTLLAKLLNDDKNSLGIRHRAALALDQIGTREAMSVLQVAERDHPFHSVRMAARESLWRRGVESLARLAVPVVSPVVKSDEIPQKATRFVFIKGAVVPENNPFQMDSWRQAYATTDSGPTYRTGRNLYLLEIVDGKPVVEQLTFFEDGYVADCEVSYDGKTVWFARRNQDSPWWHIYRLDLNIRVDSSGNESLLSGAFIMPPDGIPPRPLVRQITSGPYHDVQPVELPSGRIAFSSTRLGTRDEYHGYPCTGLSTMAPDGGDIQVVGMNFGRDSEPSVSDDGSILITRLELFYSRMKTEYNLLALRPDGTQARTIYGPERRSFWRPIHGGYGNWYAGGESDEFGNRHRTLRLTQPQPFSADNILLTTPAGPVLTQGRRGEKLLRKPFLRQGGNDPMVITTAIRLDDKTLLVAAGKKNVEMVISEFPKDGVELGIYTMDVLTGELTLLYSDSGKSCFEARPLHPRVVPPVISDELSTRSSKFTGTLFAQSVFYSQESRTRELGKLLRVVEGLPQVTRHSTHTTSGERAWKSHGGAFGRDLGIVPLAADGSFLVEVPADRFISLQVLDGDRNVVGNQLIWMNVRPGENKGCIGCHESADTSVPPTLSQSLRAARPIILPTGEPFKFHAKVWFKGYLPDEREERQRTVQAANWFGRP
ncbi:MAG: HEAT repeat domain-containing protein [Planctomycetaceae bacterium]|jgi:HEAT repeat protein|nr:HEAT repeat domain-containing protein [Planctomycetaceae bacterium]